MGGYFGGEEVTCARFQFRMAGRGCGRRGEKDFLAGTSHSHDLWSLARGGEEDRLGEKRRYL